MANGGTVNVTDFVNTVGDFFASYYTRNDSWTVSASSLASLLDSMTSMMSTVSLGISAIAALSLLVGGIGVMNIMMVSAPARRWARLRRPSVCSLSPRASSSA